MNAIKRVLAELDMSGKELERLEAAEKAAKEQRKQYRRVTDKHPYVTIKVRIPARAGEVMRRYEAYLQACLDSCKYSDSRAQIAENIERRKRGIVHVPSLADVIANTLSEILKCRVTGRM
jgi:hypothetical protein